MARRIVTYCENRFADRITGRVGGYWLDENGHVIPTPNRLRRRPASPAPTPAPDPLPQPEPLGADDALLLALARTLGRERMLSLVANASAPATPITPAPVSTLVALPLTPSPEQIERNRNFAELALVLGRAKPVEPEPEE